MANADDFVPPDVLAEDVGAFVEWDTLNPTPDDDQGNIEFNLGVHRGLMMKLKHMQEAPMLAQYGVAGLEAEYRRGWDVLDIITDLMEVARRLEELGHVGNEANYAMFEEAARMCKDGLVDIEKQMAANKPSNKPTPRPNPWEHWKGQKPWLNKRK